MAGTVDVRPYFEGLGYKVDWMGNSPEVGSGINLTKDGQTQNLSPSRYTVNSAGRAQMDPMAMMGYTALTKPSPMTADSFNNYNQIQQSIWGPYQQAQRQAADIQSRQIQGRLDQNQSDIMAAYKSSLAGLQNREQEGRAGATRNVAGRAGTSPLAAYERRKISQAYAQPYADLETYTAQSQRNAASEATMAQETLFNTLAQLIGQQSGQNTSAIMDMYGKARDDEKDQKNSLMDWLTGKSEDAWKQKEYDQSDKQFMLNYGLDKERNDIARMSGSGGGGSGDSLALMKYLHDLQNEGKQEMFGFGSEINSLLGKDSSGWDAKNYIESMLRQGLMSGDQYNKLKMELPEEFWNENYQPPVQQDNGSYWDKLLNSNMYSTSPY